MLLVALILRVALFIGMKPWNSPAYEHKVISADAIGYNELAHNLLNYGEFSRKKGQLSTDVPPGYPLFVASIYFLFGYRPYVVALVQILIGVASCLILYKLAKTMFDERLGLIAGYLLAFEYVSIMFEQVLYNDTLFTFFFLLAIYFLVNYLKTKRMRHLAYVGVLLGLAVLCRPIGMYFPLMLIFFFVLGFIKRGLKFINPLTSGIVVVLFFSLTISPWLIRNYIVFGPPLTFASRKATAFIWFAGSLEQARTGVDFKVALTRVNREFENLIKDKNLSPSQIDQYKEKFFLNKVLKHPLNFVKAQLIGVMALYLGHGRSTLAYLLGFKDGWLHSQRNQLHSIGAFFQQEVWSSLQGIMHSGSRWLKLFIFIMLFLFAMFYICVGAGFIYMLRDKRLWEVTLLMCNIFYFTVTSIPTTTMRYRIPLMPYMIILAAYAIVKLWNIKYLRESA
jgi:4-amino-4-deoxy-L-arabinose transferase-like glycosyltransferase